VKNVKLATLVILSALIILALSSNAAYGITGNFQADSTPYVGVVVLFSDAARQVPVGYCTGFLISPTVMITAGHSCLGVAAVSVCFDKGTIRYSIENDQIVYSTKEPIYNGVPTAYEDAPSSANGANKGNQAYSASDIGIIVLDEPVTGITTFATLPEPGAADNLPAKTSLKVIGYGVQYQTTPRNNGPQEAWVGYVSCNSAQVNLQPGNFAGSDKYIRLTANPSQGKGGVAFGDSGGPVIYQTANGQQTVIAIHAYVNNANCAGITYHTRLDTPQILTWVNSFLA